MATELSSGNKTTVVSSEDTLHTTTSSGTIVCAVDLSNMANGDVVELIIESKVRTGSTAAQFTRAVFAHAQSDPVVHMVPVLNLHSLTLKVLQTNGSSFSFDWAVYQV